MAIQTGLWLHEELLLLGVRPQDGRIPYNPSRDQALAAAVLTELLLAGRIRIEKRRFSARVAVAATSLLGDRTLDACLERIRTARRAASAETWISRVASGRGFTVRIAERLWHRGIVRREEKPFLLLFTRVVYPLAYQDARTAVIERLRSHLIGRGSAPPRDAALIALLKQAGMLRSVFGAAEARQHRARIKQIVKSSPGSQGLEHLLRAARSAAGAAAGTFAMVLLPVLASAALVFLRVR